MYDLRRIGAALTALVMTFSLGLTASASGVQGGYSDVDAGAWYAVAVEYVRDNGLMRGTSDTTFEPEGTMTRSMLSATLYRLAGSPAVTGVDAFSDTEEGVWYTDAVLWASQQGLVGGYGNGLFGTNDPVTREQIAVILWRYAGSPAAEAGADFADEDQISGYAAQAVDWARASGVMDGVGGNRFLPQDSATRAQVAMVLRNYLTMIAPEEPEPPEAGGRVLVAYFSATGNTETVANYIAQATVGDLFEITPAQPYTSGDLNWNDENSRVAREHEDESLRDVELTTTEVENWDSYDTVFIGYPIWWGVAAWPVDGFVEANDFTGKTVIPFCTSSSSGLGQSGELLAELAGAGNWQEGQRFRSGASASDVAAWVESLNPAQ